MGVLLERAGIVEVVLLLLALVVGLLLLALKRLGRDNGRSRNGRRCGGRDGCA